MSHVNIKNMPCKIRHILGPNDQPKCSYYTVLFFYNVAEGGGVAFAGGEGRTREQLFFNGFFGDF